jgi:hypothetical protein
VDPKHPTTPYSSATLVSRHVWCINPSLVGSHHTHTLLPIIADADVNDTVQGHELVGCLKKREEKEMQEGK